MGSARPRSRAVSAVLGVAVLAASAATAAPSAPPDRPALQQALDRLVAAGAPGAVLYVRDGSDVVRLASGYARLKGHVRARPTDRFRIGSVTKTFVATVVLQLVEEGKLSLDDPVGRRLPGRFAVGDDVTVSQLLQQRSGLDDYLDDPRTFAPYLRGDLSHAWTPAELLAIAASHRLNFAPGARWQYSNTNYLVLGLIVQAVTGHSLASELKRRIFAPLHLLHTGFDTRPRAGRMHGYYVLGKEPADLSAISLTPAWAAGAITSTTDDVATFYRALLQGSLLPSRLLRAMETTVSMGIPGERYGLGLWRTRTIALSTRQWACGPAWGHNGNYVGYQTDAFNSIDGKRQFVLFVNADENVLTAPLARAMFAVGSAAYCGTG